MMIAIARRYRDSFDAELRRGIEELSHVLRVLAVEQSAIDGYAKALGFGQLNRRYCLVEHTLLANRLVVTLPIAVEMNRECEVRRWPIFIDVLGEQNRIGA